MQNRSPTDEPPEGFNLHLLPKSQSPRRCRPPVTLTVPVACSQRLPGRPSRCREGRGGRRACQLTLRPWRRRRLGVGSIDEDAKQEERLSAV